MWSDGTILLGEQRQGNSDDVNDNMVMIIHEVTG